MNKQNCRNYFVLGVVVVSMLGSVHGWPRAGSDHERSRVPASEGQVSETPADPGDEANAARVADAVVSRDQAVYEAYPGVGPLPLVGGLATTQSVRKGRDLATIGLKDQVGRGKGTRRTERNDPRWYK